VSIKLDENLSRHLKVELSRLGHDVTTAADEGLLGHADADVAGAAAAEHRVLFSLDLDFADVRAFPPGAHPGIVVFRPAAFGLLAINSLVTSFASVADFASLGGCLAVVEPNRIRVRRPPAQDE
jgi:predicted nuclease of predicted toxin-antitoxin system